MENCIGIWYGDGVNIYSQPIWRLKTSRNIKNIEGSRQFFDKMLITMQIICD